MPTSLQGGAGHHVPADHRGPGAAADPRDRAVHDHVLRQHPGQRPRRRRGILAFARLRDPELGEWLASTVCFPNSMVDRITRVTIDEDRAEVSARFGVQDA